MSDHRKRKRNIISNKKGFSSIVGAVFAILVIVSLAGTFFVWSLQQNTLYVDAVRGVDELTLNRQSESLNITSTPNYTVVGEDVNVFTGVQNDGPITVNVTTLWVQDINGSKPFGYLMLNNSAGLLLRPGDSYPINSNVKVSGVNQNDNFTGWLITQRGNVVPLFPAHAKGDQGSAGTPGLEGDPGANGATWHVGTEVPPLTYAGGAVGDFYLNNATYKVYHKTGATLWEDVGTLTGPAGANGATWHIGTLVPPLTYGGGSIGDFYLNNATYEVYQKIGANLWEDVGSLKGIKGDPGQTFTNATTALVASGIGSIAMDFARFTHYEFPFDQAKINLTANTPTFQNYTIRSGCTYILFHVVLADIDPYSDIHLFTNARTNTSMSSSVYVLGQNTGGGSIKFVNWKLVNCTNGVVYTDDASNVNYVATLPRNVTSWVDLYFYGEVPGGNNKIATGLYPMNILLFGTKGTVDYGQNIPFVSLYFM